MSIGSSARKRLPVGVDSSQVFATLFDSNSTFFLETSLRAYECASASKPSRLGQISPAR